MALHRMSSMRSVTDPPIPRSTFNDWLKDKRVSPPDAYAGRNPLWSDEAREQLKQSLIDAKRPPRKRPTKPAVAIAPSPKRVRLSKPAAREVEAL